MHDVTDFVDPLVAQKATPGSPFQPSEVQLESFIAEDEGPGDEVEGTVESLKVKPIGFEPSESDDHVVAIDSTAFCLGEIPDGIVGAIRCSVVISEPNVDRSLDSYGPYVFALTNQNRRTIYNKLFKAVYGTLPEGNAPTPYFLLHRIRQLFEKKIETEEAGTRKDSMILLDGSLIGGTIANPKKSVVDMLTKARQRSNRILAVSKSTKLTLRQTERSIVSMLDQFQGRCYVTGLRKLISQGHDKYVGEISVARFSPFGEAFRVDTDEKSNVQPLFEHAARRAAYDGYLEELRLAHMTCVLSAVEILELQAGATKLYGMTLHEDPHHKLFPL